MSAERWMKNWQMKFAPLGVVIVVADVGQPSLFLDMAERKVVLAPSLNVQKAEKMLVVVHNWWRHQPEEAPIACAVT
jgi:patatin-like phospholipase/acyl hydrolase